MIAYVILRPDGTIVDRSFTTTSERNAWLYAAASYGRQTAWLRAEGFQPHSFEVPLPPQEEPKP